MNASRLGAAFPIVSLLLLVSGCGQDNRSPSPPIREAKIQAALEKLDPDDRKLAEEQRYCAVQTEKRLGAMGKPIKVMVKDQPVFLCCKGCTKTAQEEPDKTLAIVERLKGRHESDDEQKNKSPTKDRKEQ